MWIPDIFFLKFRISRPIGREMRSLNSRGGFWVKSVKFEGFRVNFSTQFSRYNERSHDPDEKDKLFAQLLFLGAWIEKSGKFQPITA